MNKELQATRAYHYYAIEKVKGLSGDDRII